MASDPTRDDLTTQVLAETFGRKLEAATSPRSRSSREFFRRVGREMTEPNRKQALFPDGRRRARRTPSAPRTWLHAAGGSAWQGAAVFLHARNARASSSLMMNEQVLPRVQQQVSVLGVFRYLCPRASIAHLRHG